MSSIIHLLLRQCLLVARNLPGQLGCLVSKLQGSLLNCNAQLFSHRLEDQAWVSVHARQEFGSLSYMPSPQPCLFACLLDTDSPQIAQTELEHTIPLPQLPERWDHRPSSKPYSLAHYTLCEGPGYWVVSTMHKSERPWSCPASNTGTRQATSAGPL